VIIFHTLLHTSNVTICHIFILITLETLHLPGFSRE
jgi:hypothetical protein